MLGISNNHQAQPTPANIATSTQIDHSDESLAQIEEGTFSASSRVADQPLTLRGAAARNNADAASIGNTEQPTAAAAQNAPAISVKGRLMKAIPAMIIAGTAIRQVTQLKAQHDKLTAQADQTKKFDKLFAMPPNYREMKKFANIAREVSKVQDASMQEINALIEKLNNMSEL